MRIEDLTVALRPRNPWEAVELGTALTRRHLGAVLRPWLVVSLPLLVLLNTVFALLGVAWLAMLVMWWLKPVFDRVVLFVLSRAVFGQVPGTWTTVRAQGRWGLRWMRGYLSWRRFSPWRSLNLPVDLLEGGSASEAGDRRRALVAPLYGEGALVTLVFSLFELVAILGLVTVGLLFVPEDRIEHVALSLWRTVAAQPLWLQLAGNAAAWTVTSFVEPFYVGAGFGLYLNRRTQIECWDIEMGLRRLRTRLAGAVAPALLLMAVGLAVMTAAPPALAQGNAPAPTAASIHDDKDTPASTAREVFGDAAVDDEGWKQAVKRTYEDPRVRPRRVVMQWVPRNPATPRKVDGDWAWLGQLLGLVGEYGIWAIVGLLVLVLLATAPRWLRWLRESAARELRQASPVVVETAPPPAPLPTDVPAAALRMWREGHERDALALMYRASVEDMARRADIVLVPGATEAQTLRASRRLPREQDREVFARTVRTWQYAAYAHGLPTAQEFEGLLRALVQAFGWPTATGLDRAGAEGAA